MVTSDDYGYLFDGQNHSVYVCYRCGALVASLYQELHDEWHGTFGLDVEEEFK